MATITTIQASDQVSTSRAVINTNFDNLNTAKLETTQNVGNLVNGATEKITPVDADMIGLMDSAAGNIWKKLSWANIKATLKTYFDTLYKVVGLTAYSNLNAHEGFLINGKIVPSVASNNLTVAIKGMDGNDPSASNPVYVRIGNTVRSITGALSLTVNAGNNRFNAGSAELATREIDLFVYLFWKAASSTVVISISRYPAANLHSDFISNPDNEKGNDYSSEPAATDVCVNIGRFAATLSAGAGYTWSVPTFTASNLIQRPIYNTRKLTYLPTGAGWVTAPTQTIDYIIDHNRIILFGVSFGNGQTSNATTATLTLPFANTAYQIYLGGIIDNGSAQTLPGRIDVANSSTITLGKVFSALGGFTATNEKAVYLPCITYLI